MKAIIVILSFCTFVSSTYAQNYEKKYQDKLEVNSKMISASANSTIEKTKDGIYIYKMYYPETRMITKIVSSKSKDLKPLHGLQQANYDDGTIVRKGLYVDGEKQGMWSEFSSQGEYVNHLKEGQWKSVDDNDRQVETIEYTRGLKNGKHIFYDSLGLVKYEEIYELDSLISSTLDSTTVVKVGDEMPRFPGCEDLEGTSKEIKRCADNKMLQYIYSNLEYPKSAREDDIQGFAMFRFVVDTTGQIVDLKALSGLSKDIKMECIKVIESMPTWIPGRQDKKPVKVQYTLPIRFKLES